MTSNFRKLLFPSLAVPTFQNIEHKSFSFLVYFCEFYSVKCVYDTQLKLSFEESREVLVIRCHKNKFIYKFTANIFWCGKIHYHSWLRRNHPQRYDQKRDWSREILDDGKSLRFMDFADTSRVSYCFNDPRMSWLLANRGWTVDEWDPLAVDEMTLEGTPSAEVEIKIMSDNLHEIPQIFNLLTRFDWRVRRMVENYAFTCASQIAQPFFLRL